MKSLKLITVLFIAFSIIAPMTVFNHDGEVHAGAIKARLCLDKLEEFLEIIDPVPVGCEKIDCCPSCPAPPWQIDWDVTLLDPVFDSVLLVPVNLKTNIDRIALKGFERIPDDERFAGSFRLNGNSGALEGIQAERPGKIGALRPVVKLKKGTPKGIYKIKITQRVRGIHGINREDIVAIDVTDCLPDRSPSPCEANDISPRLLQHVYGKHSPIYPRANESTLYTASARGKASQNVGVTRLSINVRQFRLTTIDILGVSVTVPLLVTTFSDTRQFLSAPLDAEISLQVKPYPENTFVTYSAEATLADGTTLSDSSISHAANLDDEKIKFYKGAVPVYVRGKHANKFDFLFVPDVDYGDDEGAYINDLEDQLFNRMFTDPPYRFKRFRRYMNVYMNMLKPELTGDAEGFSAPELIVDKPNNFDGEGADLTWVDVAVILHQNAFQDWAFLGLMEGRFCTAEAGSEVINMEALHALMFLRDEYPGDRSQPPIVHPNLFDTQKDCEDHVATHPGFDPGHCRKGPGDSTFWHWDTDYMEQNGFPIHVMDSNGTGPFAVEERCQMAWAVDNLLGSPAGSAYGPLWIFGCSGFPCDSSTSQNPSAKIDNKQFAEEDEIAEQLSERDLLLQEVNEEIADLSIRLGHDRAALLGALVQKSATPNLGAPALYKGREHEAPFRVQFSKGGRLIKELGFTDPRLIADEKGRGKNDVTREVNWNVRLPLKEIAKANRLRIVDRDDHVYLDVKLKIAR